MNLIRNILIVGLGGMMGSILRYLVYQAWGNQSFPFATLLINVAGSLLIGLVVGFGSKNGSFAEWQLFLATGVCGGFTTFSAFSLECVQLLQQNRNIAAVSYAAASVLCGMLAAFAGFFISR